MSRLEFGIFRVDSTAGRFGTATMAGFRADGMRATGQGRPKKQSSVGVGMNLWDISSESDPFDWVSERYDKAEAVYERMLEIDRKHLGPESKEARGTLLSIADMADLQGNVERGGALYAEALKIDRKLEQASLAELEGLKSKPTDTLSPEEKQALARGSYNKSNLGETLAKRIKAYRKEGREELAQQLERRKNKMGL